MDKPTDTAIETIKRITANGPFSVDPNLVHGWREMRRYAIEIGLIAERQLIAAGDMRPTQRRILTREETRSSS